MSIRNLAPLLALLCATLAPAGNAVAGDHHQPLREGLTWSHPGLRLVLWDARSSGDMVHLRFALELKDGQERARTWIGYPRYRSALSGTWQDTVFQGPHGRSRVLEVSERQEGRSFITVIVPHEAEGLLLPLGDDELRLDVRRWVARARPGGGHHVADATRSRRHPDLPARPRFEPRDREEIGRPVPAPAADETSLPYEAEEEFAALSPGRPVRLESELRWMGEKPFGDGALDEGESGELLIDVINDGERAARGLVVKISPATIPGLTYPAEISLPTIDPLGVETVSLPFRAGDDVTNGTVPVTFQVVEPYGHDAAPIEFQLTTRGTEPQLVLVDDFVLEGVSLPVPRDTIVTARLRVRNVGQATARRVTALVRPGNGVFRAHDSEEQYEVGDLAPGQVGEIVYRCYANRRAEQMQLEIELWDARSARDPVRSQVIFPLEDSSGTARIVKVSPDPPERTPLAALPAALTSDVDRFVPNGTSARPEALAVVLGVGSYVSAPEARFAAEDARTAARYFEHALGIPATRIQLLLDDEVTLGQMHRIFGKDGWLARRVHEETEVFVFFAGHGMAQVDSFVPYLVPADGDMNYVQQTGYPLDQLVESLGALDAGRVTIFIDACFSGLTREGGTLIANARPLALVPASSEISGVSLFTASRGSQLASSLDDQGHGLFSYYVFKGLAGAADVDGDRAITAGELGFYVEQAVPRAAAELDREQTPSVFIEDMEQVLVRY